MYSPTPYISIISITALLLVDTGDVLSLYLFNEARDPLFVYFLSFTVLSDCTWFSPAHIGLWRQGYNYYPSLDILRQYHLYDTWQFTKHFSPQKSYERAPFYRWRNWGQGDEQYSALFIRASQRRTGVNQGHLTPKSKLTFNSKHKRSTRCLTRRRPIRLQNWCELEFLTMPLLSFSFFVCEMGIISVLLGYVRNWRRLCF